MFSSLRVRLLVMVFLVSLPGLAFIVLASLEARQFAEQVARKDLLDKVHAIAGQQERVLTIAEQTLTLLAEIPAIKKANEESVALLANLLKQKSAYANLGIADHRGNILCSAVPFSQPENIAQQSYFRQALQTRRVAFGNYQVNRVSQKATLGLGYPLLDAAGQTTGVIFAALDLDWLQSLAGTSHSLPEESITVLDSKGTVLVRVPDPGPFIGRRQTDTDIIQTVLAQEEGTVIARGLGGQVKLYAFAPLSPSLGFGYVYAGIPTQMLMAPANRHLISHLFWLGLIIVGALAATWWLSSWLILSRLELLMQATEQLTAGDLTARTGLRYGGGEIDVLARRFDQMAEELHRRARRLQAVNHLLASATRARDVQDFLAAAVAEIASFSRCAAVGIRILRQDGSIPYEAFQGFGPAFTATESPLNLQSDRCTCISVIEGNTHQQLPFCTEGGSFYVNNATSQCPARSGQEFFGLCTRCQEAGYESVALVPLRLGQRIVGLIHVADPHEDMVPRWLVEDLEIVTPMLMAVLEEMWAQENIRILSRQLIQLQEKERQNLARELHDSLAQDLAALNIELGSLQEEIPPKATASSRFAMISRHLQEILASVQNLAHDLRPPLLDQLGLVKAIKNHCQEFTQRTGIPVDFLAAGIDETGLDPDTATTLFRLVQEGLTNVWKHTQASQATVRLVASHPTLILRLEDNGLGFDLVERQMAAVAEGRLGLVGMQERVALLDGVMRLTSQPGQGTKIVIEIPWRKAADAHSQNHPDRG